MLSRSKVLVAALTFAAVGATTTAAQAYRWKFSAGLCRAFTPTMSAGLQLVAGSGQLANTSSDTVGLTCPFVAADSVHPPMWRGFKDDNDSDPNSFGNQTIGYVDGWANKYGITAWACRTYNGGNGGTCAPSTLSPANQVVHMQLDTSVWGYGAENLEDPRFIQVWLMGQDANRGEDVIWGYGYETFNASY